MGQAASNSAKAGLITRLITDLAQFANLTFQTFRTIKATLAISFAVYGAVVLLAGHGAALSDHQVKILTRGQRKNYNYAELGFEDRNRIERAIAFSHAVLGYQGGPSNMCLTLYDPFSVKIFPNASHPNNCTNNGVVEAVVDNQPLTATGQYTMIITEPNPGVSSYALSLERINPFPSDAQPIVIAHAVNGQINPPTAQDVFTFIGFTTGTYLVSVTYTGGPVNACIYLFNRGSSTPAPAPYQGCTLNGVHETYSFLFNPPKSDTYMVLINGAGNDGTVSYNFEVSCYLGTCQGTPPPPPCTLDNTATYNATTSTLTMKFIIGNNLGGPAIWNAWLTYADPQGTDPDTMQLLFSKLQPITPPKAITVPFLGLPKEGTVGVLSTLSTTKNGIACQSWVQVNTGTDPLSP